MEFTKLIINVATVFIGLFLYLAVMNSPIGKKYEKYQYAIMAACIILAIIVGGIIIWIL